MKSFNEFINLTEAKYTFVKGWLFKGKIISDTTEFSEWHIKQVFKRPTKFGLNQKKIMKMLEDYYDSIDAPDPEEEAIGEYDALYSGVRDLNPTIENYLDKKGYCKFVLDAKHGSIKGKTEKECQIGASALDDKYHPFEKDGFKLLEVRPTKGRDKYITNKYDWYAYIEGKKSGGKRTEIGTTMSMFRGESTVKSFKQFINETYAKSGIGKWMKQSAGGEEGWDRYGLDGEVAGKCGDSKEGDPYAACLSPEKAKKLGKKGVASFVRRKREAQKKSGDSSKGGESSKGQKTTLVKTKANEEKKNVPDDKALWDRALAKAKSKFDVWPSAYGSAWASKWYKEQGGTWSVAKESIEEKTDNTAAVAKLVKQAVKKYVTGTPRVRSKGGKVRFIMLRADKIDNKLRKMVLDVEHPNANVKKMDDIHYANISDRIISAGVDVWIDALGLKVEESIEEEAEHDGKKVTLNKPFRTPDGPKKFGVYVKNEKGTVVVVRFGDPNMDIKRDSPGRRKSFRARHNCADPGPKWKARYWSCYQWRDNAAVED